MSIGRGHVTDSKNVRDVEAEYAKAYVAEYESYKTAGLDDRAKAVAAELRKLGHEVESAPKKERAVSPEPLERAVEADAAPKRRGRPSSKAAE